jgi:hypothetical protein
MDVKLNWLYIRIAKLNVRKRGWRVIVPIVRKGEYGDYHSIMWMWFYVILGRELYTLERDLDATRQVEYKRSA